MSIINLSVKYTTLIKLNAKCKECLFFDLYHAKYKNKNNFASNIKMYSNNNYTKT